MYPVPTQCPVCGGELTVTRLHCFNCDSSIEGGFSLGRLSRLTPEQWDFIVTFIRCEGKITRMEKELQVSYPTVRARLDDVILALGFRPSAEEADEEEAAQVSEAERRRVLDDLAAGRITSAEAIARLRTEAE